MSEQDNARLQLEQIVKDLETSRQMAEETKRQATLNNHKADEIMELTEKVREVRLIIEQLIQRKKQ